MKISILEKRLIFFIVSAVFFLFSLWMIFFWKLNLGIDMTGGIAAEFRYENFEFSQELIAQEAQIAADHSNISGDIVNTLNTYKISGENIFVVEAGFNQNLWEKEIEEYKLAFRSELERIFADTWDITLTRYTNIGASFGDYIKNTAKLTLILAIIAIAVYIGYAFSGTVAGVSSLSFALITIITLFHDVLISSGIYILISQFLPQFQMDTFFITALLTILGYSINDTIVIFDRIRSNLRDFWGRGKKLDEIITLSIQESMTRSIYTSMTVIFVLLCILVWGPNSIAGFTLTMLLWSIVGTFSSIFIASPLLYEFHKNTQLSVYVKREERSEEDKMVV
jgi:preprotein translocase SecF subunit